MLKDKARERRKIKYGQIHNPSISQQFLFEKTSSDHFSRIEMDVQRPVKKLMQQQHAK